MPKSSQRLRRSLNGLIRCINRRLPLDDRIEELPAISFRPDPDMEHIVHLYYQAIMEMGTVRPTSRDTEDVPAPSPIETIDELEALYGRRLDIYLAPYADLSEADISPDFEYKRVVVANHRVFNETHP